MNAPSTNLTQAAEAFRAGQLDEAERRCRAVIGSEPKLAAGWHLMAVIQASLNRHAAAVESFGKAVALNPANPGLYYDRARYYLRVNRPLEAIGDFELALARHAAYPEALHDLAATLDTVGRFDEAVETYDRFLALRPASPGGLSNRGNVLQKLGRSNEALESYDHALALKADFADAHINRGAVLRELGRLDEALAALNAALAHAPGHIIALNNRGTVLHALGRADEALADYQAAAANPAYGDAHANLANALHGLGRYDEALASYRRAMAGNPRHPQAFNGAADCAAKLCDFPARAAFAAEMPARVKDASSVISPFLLLGYSGDPALQLTAARKYLASRVAPSVTTMPATGSGGTRIRIVYLSADFRDHPVARLMATVIEAHDRDRFEVICAALNPDDSSPIRWRIAGACDRFLPLDGLDDAAAAEAIAALNPDILIDLTGHTQLGRPGVLARKPAPVQAAYLGFAASTGLEAMDYLIADATAVPEADQRAFTEVVVRLPGGFFPGAIQSTAEPPPRKAAGLPAKGFVFSCFNAPWKITPQLFDIWMRLLTAAPGSVLWLSGDRPATEENLRREAGARGVDPARLVFKAPSPFDEHLAAHGLADLFLDTLPFNAHATAADALAAGLPVVTCRGTAFAGRVAASLLEAAGLPELITEDLTRYEALARDLANEPKRLAAIRSQLADNQASCALFDTALHARELESAFSEMHRRRLDGRAPEPFTAG